METTASLTHRNARYATATLVTDTMSFDVIDSTERTVTLRSRRKVDGPGTIDARCDVGAYGLSVMFHETESVPTNPTRIYRMRKNGTFRLGTNYGTFRFTNDPPAERVDYRN